METNESIGTTISDQGTAIRAGMVHFILSHSYFMFLGAVVLGLLLDIMSPIKIFGAIGYSYLGALMIILGSLLVYWAQSTSNRTLKEMHTKNVPRNFEGGPYRYSRNPTHIGLTVMTLGLAFVLNSFFSVIFVIIASLFTKFFFLRKEEAILEKRYGQPYRDYKKKVNTWV